MGGAEDAFHVADFPFGVLEEEAVPDGNQGDRSSVPQGMSIQNTP